MFILKLLKKILVDGEEVSDNRETEEDQTGDQGVKAKGHVTKAKVETVNNGTSTNEDAGGGGGGGADTFRKRKKEKEL